MSYYLTTAKGTAATATIPVAFDTTGATLTAEFAESSTFRTISLTKPVTGSGRTVTLSLTAADVDSLTDSCFRIKSVKSGKTSYIQSGRIDYKVSAAQEQAAATAAAQTAALSGTFGPFFVGKPGVKYRTVLGAIRNVGSAGGYWQPIVDTAHKPTGIASITTDATEITVNYNFNGSAIGTLLAVTDETMAAEGYFVGSSVAANQCKIRLGRRKTIQDYVYWDATLNSGAGGFKSANNAFTVVSYTAGVLTLSHAAVFGGFQNNVDLATRGGAYRAVVSTSGSPVGETQTKLELWTAAGTLATTGHTDMKFYLKRYDIAGWVDPRTYIDTTSQPNHNIWIYGLHEA